ncbi:TIMELESS-interacting protein [Ananas comosus]|uniref:TIMELESS-interacting protein n=1 Tax=Ananas comosus TaxID=4615 RepID=A0A6P5GZB5_ANACO|nr:TIMELESS-interacting protein [Ananas comosus]
MQGGGSAVGGAAAAAAAAVPTGCFKCGRPGHWSRDCPSSSASNPNPNPRSGFPTFNSKSSQNPPPSSSSAPPATKSSVKKAPRTRPKLTPELLLSEDGLGYVLRHFPRAFKYHGRGHEVTDLGNLIGLYAEWHSRLLPYFSFDQFVRKVERVGASNRVRRCVAELRDRVAKGEDPSKLHEPPAEQATPDCEPGENVTGDPISDPVEPPLGNQDADTMQEVMLDEVYRTTTDEPMNSADQEARQDPQSTTSREENREHASLREPLNQPVDSSATELKKIQITEEQRARMEANRLKALEKAAARARSSQA